MQYTHTHTHVYVSLSSSLWLCFGSYVDRFVVVLVVKHDCVFGDDLDLNEISYVFEVLSELNRHIVYSLSLGTSVTPAMGKDISGLVNMYRITIDDWDLWEDVKAHFDVTRDFSTTNMIGGKGLKGYSWPNLDMLQFGWLTYPTN
ncbi:hypothetical protein GmHk_03G007611 [Glycine max]|nr:hypothetical protein GmHk_03G007611 [Glycine max]